MPRRQGKIIRRIIEEVAKGNLPQPFTPAQVDKAANITCASTFLPKHAVSKPGKDTKLFERVSQPGARPVLYRLKSCIDPSKNRE